MGWDAYASVETGEVNGKYQIIDDYQRKIFMQAAALVENKSGGGGDWLFSRGGLDNSDCAFMLEKGTGRSCWDKDWDKEDVQMTNKNADWDFEYDPDKAWAYWSARVFLDTCAKLELSIRFTW